MGAATGVGTKLGLMERSLWVFACVCLHWGSSALLPLSLSLSLSRSFSGCFCDAFKSCGETKRQVGSLVAKAVVVCGLWFGLKQNTEFTPLS